MNSYHYSAQCAELCWQLRGMAGVRQVKNAKVALQHNIGLGGAAVRVLGVTHNLISLGCWCL